MQLNVLNDLAEAMKALDGKKTKEAVTLRPKYSSLNQHSLSNMNERCDDLVSRTCLAGAKSATSHSASYDPILELGEGVLDRLER